MKITLYVDENILNILALCAKCTGYLLHSQNSCKQTVASCQKNVIGFKGTFFNYVDKILAFFVYLPTPGWHLWRISFTVKYKVKSAYRWHF